MEADQGVEKAKKSMKEMRKTHMDLVQEMRHHNTIIIQERNATLKEVAELKTKLTEAIREKDEANKVAQEACEEAVKLREERDTTNHKVAEADTRVEREVKAIEVKMEGEFKDLLVIYNANVPRNHNLNRLGEDYPFQLYKAWNRLVEDEK